MSFALTVDQLLDGTKTVTRRLGWRFLKKGDVLMACRKCQGLRKGERIKRLGLIQVRSVSFEELRLCTTADARREGFPYLTGHQFVRMFCKAMNVEPSQMVTRIEFTRIAKRRWTRQSS